MNEKWKVNLEVFEGPLDLLLHLINKYEIDIYDIPIKDITDQYLNYLHAMQLLRLDVAGDYLVMAATLMSIKSQLLLPRNDDWEEEGEAFDVEEDSIEKLQERLLEYRKIKYASSKLSESRSSRENYYSKPHADLSRYQQAIPMNAGELSIGHLIGAFSDMLKRKQWDEPQSNTINLEEITISDKIIWLEQTFKQNSKRLSFNQLFTSPSKREFVVTFLAVLEMIKENRLLIEQTESFGEIFLSAVEA